jgi:hypothetical protein
MQFQASQAGISENKLDGRGKINLAKYFVTIEVYDYSISEDETINLKDGVKNMVVTRLGLQVRFTDAETGVVFQSVAMVNIKAQLLVIFLFLGEFTFLQTMETLGLQKRVAEPGIVFQSAVMVNI